MVLRLNTVRDTTAETLRATSRRHGNAGRELARIITDNGFEPHLILSIARGGLFVAGSLSGLVPRAAAHPNRRPGSPALPDVVPRERWAR
ncbi:hypothetical protein ABZ412_28675 [Nocardia sp. NPDC005746]|uniref:hypothetical protein n=1 Tax=Nocardia sp. NPDC005746 TaxID=3157062 RepID=UPI0033D1C759